MGRYSRHLFPFAGSTGPDSGVTDFIGDYSSGLNAYIQPPQGEVWLIYTLIVTMVDDGTMRNDYYGGIAGGLTNGIRLRKYEGSALLVDITNGKPIKTNMDWAQYTYETRIDQLGSGDNYLHARWGSTIPIRLRDTDRLQIEMSDDFTGLISQTFNFQGITE